MDEILSYIRSVLKSEDLGDLPNYPDPAAPTDLGSALTQDEIDALKSFIKEIKERFTLPPP